MDTLSKSCIVYLISRKVMSEILSVEHVEDAVFLACISAFSSLSIDEKSSTHINFTAFPSVYCLMW